MLEIEFTNRINSLAENTRDEPVIQNTKCNRSKNAACTIFIRSEFIYLASRIKFNLTYALHFLFSRCAVLLLLFLWLLFGSNRKMQFSQLFRYALILVELSIDHG